MWGILWSDFTNGLGFFGYLALDYLGEKPAQSLLNTPY